MTESLLIEQARKGDADAFARLVDPWTMRLTLLIRHVGGRVLGPDQDDEDLVQVVLARGAVADRRKYVEAKGRDTVRHLESAIDGPSAPPPTPIELATSISRIASRHEEEERAAAALAALPDHYREVVVPHLLEARSLREIAEGLGVTANAVWERLHRGLALMRAQLG